LDAGPLDFLEFPATLSARRAFAEIVAIEFRSKMPGHFLFPKISTAQFNLKRHFSPVSI
jgi:hypothetical protein